MSTSPADSSITTPIDARTGRVVVLDGDPHAGQSIVATLRLHGFDAQLANDVMHATTLVRHEVVSVVIADASSAARTFREFTERLHAASPSCVVIAASSDVTASRAIAWVRAGALDILAKPFDDAEIVLAVERAMQRSSLTTTRISSRPTASSHKVDASRGNISGIIGSDPQLQRALELGHAASTVRSTVLIQGESGTGKSMLARAIHRSSPRANMPFVELACGSVPETLLESELFGHVKGAFTGALADKKGRFLAAHGGTLFLDEINSASPIMQLKLLRVLQEKKFEAVGSDDTIEVDVRVIVASNQPLAQLVRDGRFREDLFYRVHVLPIDLPPLRDRPNDAQALAEHFLTVKSAEIGRTILGFTDTAMNAMRGYRWPGNVRELENAIERAALLCLTAHIGIEHLPSHVQRAESESPINDARAHADPIRFNLALEQPTHSEANTLANAMRAPEREALRRALDANAWSRSRTAEALGINRTTLYRKMRDLGLDALRNSA